MAGYDGPHCPPPGPQIPGSSEKWRISDLQRKAMPLYSRPLDGNGVSDISIHPASQRASLVHVCWCRTVRPRNCGLFLNAGAKHAIRECSSHKAGHRTLTPALSLSCNDASGAVTGQGSADINESLPARAMNLSQEFCPPENQHGPTPRPQPNLRKSGSSPLKSQTTGRFRHNLEWSGGKVLVGKRTDSGNREVGMQSTLKNSHGARVLADGFDQDEQAPSPIVSMLSADRYAL